MSARKPSLRISRAGIIGSIVVFVVAGICVRLGIWQLHRLAERKALNRAVAARMFDKPLDLTRIPTDTAGLIYRRVRLRGPLDNQHSIVIAGRTFQGEPGVHLLSPLRLPGGGAILVDRGWLPSPDASTVNLTPYNTTDTLTYVGLVMPLHHEPSSVHEGPAGPNGFRRVWHRYDLAIHKQFPYPVAPVYVWALPDSTPDRGGIPVGPQSLPAREPAPKLSNGPHLSYAIQWFGFATIGVIGWLILATSRGALGGGSYATSPPIDAGEDRDRDPTDDPEP